MNRIMKSAMQALRNLFLPRCHSTGLPGVTLVFPKDLPAAGFQLRLRDPETGSEMPFMNSSDLEVVLGHAIDGRSSIKIRLDDFVTEAVLRDLREGMPLIVKVTQLYEVAAIKQV